MSVRVRPLPPRSYRPTDQDAELLTPECRFDSCWLRHVFKPGRVRLDGQVLCLSSRRSRVRIPYTSPPFRACRLTDSRRYPPKVEIEVRFLARAPHWPVSSTVERWSYKPATGVRLPHGPPTCSCHPAARMVARLATHLSSSLSGNTIVRG